MNAQTVIKKIKKQQNLQQAKFLQRYFKTAKGEYGEGDVFWGLKVPQTRQVAKECYRDIALSEVQVLLKSKVHEVRFYALDILCWQYAKSDTKVKNKIFKFYLKNFMYVNNWDLVDTSAATLVGEHIWCVTHDARILYKWANSSHLWTRRISVIATHYFIRQGYFEDTFNLAVLLLNDREDLMHKAVGWMLREVGKKNRERLTDFLVNYRLHMPRTMLRYALEHYPEAQRKKFMARL